MAKRRYNFYLEESAVERLRVMAAELGLVIGSGTRQGEGNLSALLEAIAEGTVVASSAFFQDTLPPKARDFLTEFSENAARRHEELEQRIMRLEELVRALEANR